MIVFNSLTNEQGVFYLVWGLAFLGLLLALNLIHSRVGRALQAIHDGEEAAIVLGGPTARYKIQIFILSAVYASVAGSLYGHTFSYLTPDEFGSMKSVLLVVMVVVGGMRTVWGAVVGTLLMGSLTEWLSWMENYWLVVLRGRVGFDPRCSFLREFCWAPETVSGGSGAESFPKENRRGKGSLTMQEPILKVQNLSKHFGGFMRSRGSVAK